MSLNVRSKLKGHCTDVKSRCVTSVGPSLNPHSLSFKKILVLLSLKGENNLIEEQSEIVNLDPKLEIHALLLLLLF